MIKKVYWLLIFLSCISGISSQSISLQNNQLKLFWTKSSDGWKIVQLKIKRGSQWVNVPHPSGEHTLLYSSEMPSMKSSTKSSAQSSNKSSEHSSEQSSAQSERFFYTVSGKKFPEDVYHYQAEQWAESINAVSLNTAGKAVFYFPEKAVKKSNRLVSFMHETALAKIHTEWSLDPAYPTDIKIKQSIVPKLAGYFSLASPSIAITKEKEIAWASVPGYFLSNYVQPNFVLAYAYGHGIPSLPVIYRERSASTLCPFIQLKNGITLSVIPDPKNARDPWEQDKNTHQVWNIGLSHQNRKSAFAPTLYYPVLGEPQSLLNANDQIDFSFRYSIINGDWFKAVTHAANDIYQVHKSLYLRKTKQSLTDRIHKLHQYLLNPNTSKWNIEEYRGKAIGAQSYLGGVVGNKKDAMKNADYGAMWMLANTTRDSSLLNNILPYAANFKQAQQITDEGFFKGALAGQYYLAKSKKFTEEWGEVVEPVAVTYYTMIDIGNILLFEPQNKLLRQYLRNGAEWLLKNQQEDGSWQVAYDRNTAQPLFPDMQDLRPTFYGLLVAYRLLNEQKYLDAAVRGADWLVKNAVNTGNYIGVCGDARYAPDFATAQSAQALLDLYEITSDIRYKEAAIQAAKYYVTSIYTHPVSTKKIKKVNGVLREDWEITQAGLCFEHGGIFGSSNRHGPIILASHAGMFLRMYQLTHEQIFADLARSAVWGRDAFVDSATSVASYYWQSMNKGAGPYPHHAWWQIGFLTDYLMEEAALRSNGKVKFPRGFITPKVGPHQTYGFSAGTVNGHKVDLIIDAEMVHLNKAQVDYILARSVTGKNIFLILLNNSLSDTDVEVTVKSSQKINTHLNSLGIKIIELN